MQRGIGVTGDVSDEEYVYMTRGLIGMTGSMRNIVSNCNARKY